MRSLVVLVALLVTACGGGVSLLTSDRDDFCMLSWTAGRLVVDARYGTSIVPDGHPSQSQLDRPYVVAWPAGYTARRNGSEVDVLDGEGRVVATTGNSYTLQGGGSARDDWPERTWSACDDPELVS